MKRNRLQTLSLGLALAMMPTGCGGGGGGEPPPETLTWSVPGDGRPATTGGGAGAPEPAPEATEAPAAPACEPRPLDDDRTTDLCRDPVLGDVRPLLPGLPLCEKGVRGRFVTVRHDGRRAMVVGVRDARPTWVDGAMRYLAAAIVDGRRLEDDEVESFWRALPSLAELPEPEIPNLLQGVLLARRVYHQIATLEQARQGLRGWPAALARVERKPPGMCADATGHHLRLYSQRRTTTRGGECRELAQHEATLTPGGEVTVRPGQAWAEGTMQGEPCGEPLPEPE
ncbi:MAG: hypothetical protein ACOCXM_06390 [Myxococcota bacterium]